MEKNCNHLDVRATPSRHGPNYGIYEQQKCNLSAARVTTSGRGPNMVLPGARYGKPLHSCLSGRPQLAFERHLEKYVPNSL